MAKYPTGPDLLADFSGLFRSQARAASGAVTGSAADPLVAPEVTNLQLTSTSVLDNYQGSYVSIVRATWDPIVADTSETADSDVSPVTDYLCSYAYANEGWSREGGTGGVNAFTTHAVPTGAEVTVRVRARRESGAVGPYTTATIVTSRDETPPPRPSAPTVIGTVRGVSVGWNGLFVQPDGTGSAPRPADFAYVIAEVSTTSDFAVIVKGGVLSEAGQTAVTRLTDGTPFTAYARLVAVDHSGNRSALSAVTTGGSIAGLVDKDLADAAVTAQKILDGAVSTLKLADNAVVGAKLADLSVSVGKIVDGAIASTKLANGAVVAAKINVPAIDPSSGNLTANSVSTNQLTADAVTASKIAADQIGAREIVAESITANEIASDAVVARVVASDAIIARHIVAGEVISEKIAANAITSDKVATNSLTATQIAAGAITADELYTYAVTGKVITGGVIATGVSGEDRLEIRDETAYDPYLGYSRSIRDTLRWIRGYDNAIVGEIRGYMGDVGAYGIHLNSHVQIGGIQSEIHPMGRLAAHYNAKPSGRWRMGRDQIYCTAMDASGQNFYYPFPVAMDTGPTLGLATVNAGGSPSGVHGVWSGLFTVTNLSFSAGGISGAVLLSDGQAPGSGSSFWLSYLVAIVV